MIDFYKVLDAKGRSYTTGENFTDPYVPALKAMGENHEDMVWSDWTTKQLKRSKNPVPVQRVQETYEVTACSNKHTGKFVLAIYKSQSKDTLIKATKNDKPTTTGKFASIAKHRKGNR